jgi:hypothetical protein
MEISNALKKYFNWIMSKVLYFNYLRRGISYEAMM